MARPLLESASTTPHTNALPHAPSTGMHTLRLAVESLWAWAWAWARAATTIPHSMQRVLSRWGHNRGAVGDGDGAELAAYATRMDPAQVLGYDEMAHVMSFLDATDLCFAGTINRQWKEVRDPYNPNPVRFVY